MKINQLTKTVCTALLMASSALVIADEYPASDFKPKVVYSDGSASSAPSAKAPASVEADSNFPAANFQPKVVFSDNAYQHSAAAPSVAKSASASVAASSGAQSENVASTAPAAENNNHLFGLLALAAVGFLLYNKKSCVKSGVKASVSNSSSAAAVVNTVSDAATGVEKYLEKQGINKTGVARYLEKQTANPATSVAKYVAKQKIKDREAAEARKTGVERYLRDKV